MRLAFYPILHQKEILYVYARMVRGMIQRPNKNCI